MIRRSRVLPRCLLLAFAAHTASAQTFDDGGIWSVFLGQGSLRSLDAGLERWRWWLDVQHRQRDEYEHLDQFLVRPGLGYRLHDRFSVWAGYALIGTDPRRGDEWLEHRAWQQTIWNLPVDGFTLSWRNRLEQRWFEIDAATGWRLRELVKVTVPLTEDKGWFVSAWDEAFIDLNDTTRLQRAGFRQNRAFLGLGAFVDDDHKMSVEIGYLNQWIDVAAPRDDRLNHLLSVTFVVNF